MCNIQTCCWTTRSLSDNLARNTQRTLDIFQIKCPLLFDSLAEIDNPTLFSRRQDLLRKLLQISVAPCRVSGSPVDSLWPKSNAIVESLTYLPCLPRVRVQGCYQAHRVRSTSEVICNKKAGRQPTLLQGIFLVHCAHGVTYRFSAMVYCESPYVPLTTLCTRSQEAPRTIVYYNGFNCHPKQRSSPFQEIYFSWGLNFGGKIIQGVPLLQYSSPEATQKCL